MKKVQLKKIANHPSSPGAGWLEANRAGQTDVPVLTQQVAIDQRPLIMVIDDSATVVKIVETCLGREGYAVKSFSDGITALRWLMEPDALVPTLILLDIGLPKMDGYEVAHRLKTKSQLSQTVIIILTRRDGPIEKLKGRLAGANDYIVKPFQTHILLATVKTHVGEPIHGNQRTEGKRVSRSLPASQTMFGSS